MPLSSRLIFCLNNGSSPFLGLPKALVPALLARKLLCKREHSSVKPFVEISEVLVRPNVQGPARGLLVVRAACKGGRATSQLQADLLPIVQEWRTLPSASIRLEVAYGDILKLEFARARHFFLARNFKFTHSAAALASRALSL